MEHSIKISPAPRLDVDRTEKEGECYKSEDNLHYFLIRKADTLHVKVNSCINTLFDNKLTADRIKNNIKYIKIKRSEFNKALNSTIFDLNYIGKIINYNN